MEKFDGAVICDLSWLVRRSQAAYSLRNFRGRPTGHLYGALFSAGRVLRWAESKNLCLIFAKDTRTYKSTIVPSYKSNRVKGNVHSLLSVDEPALINFLLGFKNVFVCESDLFEADDVVYTLSHTVRGSSCILWGADKDLRQSSKFTQRFERFSQGKPTFLGYEMTRPFELACMGKPSNGMKVGIKKNVLKKQGILTHKSLDLLEANLLSLMATSSGTLGDEQELYRKLHSANYSLVLDDVPSVFKDNVYLGFPRMIPSAKLKWHPRGGFDKALNALKSLHLHEALTIWGVA